MKAELVYGSPNGKNSASWRLGSSFGKGLESAGWETNETIIYDKDIKHCLGCKSCWSATPGKCVQADDMAGIIERLSNTDLVVLSTPLYYFMVPGKTKDYLDRHMPIFYQTVLKMYGKSAQDWIDKIKFVLISCCGFMDKNFFGGLKLSMQHIYGKAYAQDFLVPNSAGMSADRNGTEFSDYYKLMEKLGAEFGKGMSISPESRREFEDFTTMNEAKIAEMRARFALINK